MPGEIQEFVSLTPWTVIFQICNLLLLTLLLKKFLFKPVMRVLNERQREIDQIYVSADETKAEALKLKEAYDDRMSKARGEADALIRNATMTARIRGDEIVETAKDEAGHIRRKAEEDIEQQKRKAFTEVKNSLADMAIDIAEKLVGREVNESDNARLIDDFLKNAGEGK